MPVDVREQKLQSVEAELRHERASALGRTGRKLEQLIQETEAAIVRLRVATPESRAEALLAFRTVHEQAHYQRWCYVVQREAIGLNVHDDVYAAYRIPACPPELR